MEKEKEMKQEQKILKKMKYQQNNDPAYERKNMVVGRPQHGLSTHAASTLPSVCSIHHAGIVARKTRMLAREIIGGAAEASKNFGAVARATRRGIDHTAQRRRQSKLDACGPCR